MRCAALGCHRHTNTSASVKNGLFCRIHCEKIPPDFRAPNKYREAIAYLGKLDGYLVDVPKRRVTLTDNEGGEYV